MTYVDHDSLSHGETISVVTTSDLKVVSLVFVTEAIGFDFLSHSSFNEVDANIRELTISCRHQFRWSFESR
jgi:hypothetical protein